MKFITTPTELSIVLDRREQLAAFKAKISIKKSEIADLAWHDVFSAWRRWEVRLPGASIPRRLIAGSYWTEEGWDFLYLKRPIGLKVPKVMDVIVLTLDNHSKYQRIALSASHSDFQILKKWLGSRASSKR